MNKLRFDLQAAKEQLTHVFRDRIAAQSAVHAVQNVDLEQVQFAGLDTGIANLPQLIAAMKSDLQQAQADGLQWSNEVQPHLTTIPQAAINYAAIWNVAMPLVIAELDKADPNRAELGALFQGLGDSIARQVADMNSVAASLESIETAVAADAVSFSDSQSAFQQLEAFDRQNIAAARATLARLALLIDGFNQEIGVDTINADKDLALATTAMEWGKKGGKPGQVVGLTIALVSIVNANFAISDLINAVEARVAAAQKQSQFQLNLTSLTAQLLALETASSSLQSLRDEIGDMLTSLQQTIARWQENAAAITAIVADLASTKPIGTILSQFDLGQAQAQWDDLSAFAVKWQSMEVSARAADLLVVDGGGTQPGAIAPLLAIPSPNVHAFPARRTSC